MAAAPFAAEAERFEEAAAPRCAQQLLAGLAAAAAAAVERILREQADRLRCPAPPESPPAAGNPEGRNNGQNRSKRDSSTRNGNVPVRRFIK